MPQDFVKQDTALERMRESYFDCYSAFGEVVDNSIQAFADDIRLKFTLKGDALGKIGQVLLVDNGDGMEKDLLYKCLKPRHYSGYNNRDRIGRFDRNAVNYISINTFKGLNPDVVMIIDIDKPEKPEI